MNSPMQRFLETYLLLVEEALLNSFQEALTKIKRLCSLFSRSSVSACVISLRTGTRAIETAH